MKRREELKSNLDEVQQRIERAQLDYSAVRTADSHAVELMVVTKFFPAADIEHLYQLGVRHVGENRDQEASAKAADFSHLAYRQQEPLRWSFIGQLQTNKAKSVVQYATDVHSVDRLSLVKSLSKAYQNQVARFESEEAKAPAALELGGLKCFVQVNLDEKASTAGRASEGLRGGGDRDALLKIADALEQAEGLSCAGVMAVPPLGVNPDQAFEQLYILSKTLQAEFPHAIEVSAGMSNDMEAAIRWGSTIVRVGSQIMGPRTLVQ